MIITLAPGPDILYLLTKSLADGAKSGVVLGLGLSSGIVFHTGLVMVGVAALIKNSPALFAALKYLGAAYLLFLSAAAWKDKGETKLAAAEGRTQLANLYRRGILMNVTNPKVLLFFLAFLPQFVAPGSDNTSGQIALLGFVFALQAAVIFALVAFGAGKLRPWLAQNKNAGAIMSKVQAFVLAAIALAMIFGA